LSKKRRAKLCPEPQDAEALARAVNAEPWEPMPGMAKKRCSRCSYWFAVPITEAEATLRCQDCASLGTRPASARSA
jgi:DNA-directed RNA polymerase subunit RPC12/RpoP